MISPVHMKTGLIPVSKCLRCCSESNPYLDDFKILNIKRTHKHFYYLSVPMLEIISMEHWFNNELDNPFKVGSVF